MARSRKTEAGPAETGPEPEPFADQAESVELAAPEERSFDPSEQSEPVRAAALAEPAQVAAPPAPRRVFAPLALGGVLAALAGSAVTIYLADSYPQALGLGQGPDPSAFDNRLAAQDRQIADLSARLAARPAPSDGPGQAALDKLRGEGNAAVADLAARIDGLETQIASLRQDLTAARTTAQPGAAAADIAAATEEATRQAQAAAQEAARVRAQTETIVHDAAISAALSELDADIENGAPLDGALTKLAEAGVTVPETLSSQSQGVPTLAALRQGFPPAARDALAISLGATAGQGTTWDRFSAFLRSQTKARSLSPRAGDDPDAVLSRAEAALSAGDLTAALKEIEALPQGGRDRMAEWAGLAQRRLAAREAWAALSAGTR